MRPAPWDGGNAPGVDVPGIEMYLVAMEQLAREDIAAAAAVHNELGRDYEGAVAESLVERIGDEIDKRVDARLGERGARAARPGRRGQQGRSSWEAVALALGSMVVGGITAASVLNSSHGDAAAAVLIWVIIGIINIAYARRR